MRRIQVARYLKPGVKLILYVWGGDDTQKLKNYIKKNPMLDKKIELTVDYSRTDHSKTLVVDDKILAEGSFNWLGSSISETAGGHNLDSTIVLEGPAATRIIAENR